MLFVVVQMFVCIRFSQIAKQIFASKYKHKTVDIDDRRIGEFTQIFIKIG